MRRWKLGGSHSGCSQAPSGGLEENSQFVEAETKHRSGWLSEVGEPRSGKQQQESGHTHIKFLIKEKLFAGVLSDHVRSPWGARA